MAMTPWATSSGLEPWRRGVLSHCARNWASVWRVLATVGPGPIPFTRIRGASASAMDWVRAQRAALVTV